MIQRRALRWDNNGNILWEDEGPGNFSILKSSSDFYITTPFYFDLEAQSYGIHVSPYQPNETSVGGNYPTWAIVMGVSNATANNVRVRPMYSSNLSTGWGCTCEFWFEDGVPNTPALFTGEITVGSAGNARGFEPTFGSCVPQALDNLPNFDTIETFSIYNSGNPGTFIGFLPANGPNSDWTACRITTSEGKVSVYQRADFTYVANQFGETQWENSDFTATSAVGAVGTKTKIELF